jgi:hypothetical protein
VASPVVVPGIPGHHAGQPRSLKISIRSVTRLCEVEAKTGTTATPYYFRADRTRVLRSAYVAPITLRSRT